MNLCLNDRYNPRQEEFYLATARHICYGGSRGGGKSHAVRRKASLLCLNYENLKVLLLRRTFQELRENHQLPLMEQLNGIAKYKDDDKAFIFPNGSRLKLGYCDREADVFQYQGQEYDVIFFEEATQFTESQMQFLTTCNRSTRTDFKPRIYYTCNPGGVGHAWVKRLFIDRQYRNKEKAEDYVFIRASVYDNDALMENNPEYVESLENLPDDLRRAHLEGDWNVYQGQYFKNFRHNKHVIKPFKIPDWWTRFRSIDWGYNDPCAIYWHAVDGDGNVYTYREYYKNRVVASDVALRTLQLTGSEKISYTVASPDMWQTRGAALKKEGGYAGENIAETFADNGVFLTPADNSRVLGWQRMQEFLDWSDEEGAKKEPQWFIFETCENLIRTIPILIYSETDVEDVAASCEDHAAESCRYGLMSRPIKPKPPTEEIQTRSNRNWAFEEPKKRTNRFFGK